MIAVPFFNDILTPNYRIKFKDMIKRKLVNEPNFCIETDDLLQAYWQVACWIVNEKLMV